MAKIESVFCCHSRKLLISFNLSGRRRALPVALAVAAILLLGATTVASAQTTQATQLWVEGYPTDVAAGVPYTGMIYAEDDNGEVVNYNGVVTVTTSQNSTGIPVVMKEGYGVFFAAFPTADTSSSIPDAARKHVGGSARPTEASGPTGPTGSETITASGTVVNASGQTVALTSNQETGIYVEAAAQFVVTTNADDVDDDYENLNPSTNAPYCTDQSLPGATADTYCTLREALYAASNNYWDNGIASTITFSSSAFASATTITVTPETCSDGCFYGAMYVPPATVITGLTSGSGSSLTNLVTISGGTVTNGDGTYGTSLLYTDDSPWYPGVALANLNFTNGDGTDATGDDEIGGALNNDDDTMTVTNCNFTNNKGDGAGAIYNWDGAMLITGGTFSGNTSTGNWEIDAGGISNDSLVWWDYYEGDALTGSAAATHRGMTHHSSFDALSAFGVSKHSGVHASTSFLSMHSRRDLSSRVPAIKARRDARQNKRDTLRKASTAKPALDEQYYYFWGVQELVGVTIAGNSGSYAGGLYNTGYATVYDSTIGQPPSSTTLTGNSGYYVGGLISDCEEYWVSEGDSSCYDETDNYWDGQTIVAGSTINQNTGGEAGGTYNWDSATLVAADSTFSNNTSSGVDWEYPDAGGVATNTDARTLLYYDTFYGNQSTTGMGAGAVYVSGYYSNYGDSLLAMVSPTMTANSGYYGAAFDDCGFWGCDDSGAEPGYSDRTYNALIAGNITTDSTASDDGVSADENGLEVRASDSYGSAYTSLSALGNYGGPTQTVLPLPGNPAICKPSDGTFYDYLLYMMSGQGDVFLVDDQRGDGFPSSNATYAALSGAEEPCVDSGSVQSNYSIAFTTQPPSSVPVNSTFAAAVTLTESGLGMPSVTIPLTLVSGDNNPGNLTGGSAITNNQGVAAYSLAVDKITDPGYLDTLLATLALSPDMNVVLASAARPADDGSNSGVALTAVSDGFSVILGDFTIAVSGSGTGTVMPGSSTTYKLNIAPMYGVYAGPISFTGVDGLPAGATATFSPSTIPANSTGTTMVTMTITAPPANYTGGETKAAPGSRIGRHLEPFALAFLLLLGAGGIRRNGRKMSRMLCIAILMVSGTAALLLGGCQSSLNGYFDQTQKSYTVTVHATDGYNNHAVSLTLDVQ